MKNVPLHHGKSLYMLYFCLCKAKCSAILATTASHLMETPHHTSVIPTTAQQILSNTTWLDLLIKAETIEIINVHKTLRIVPKSVNL